MKYFIDFEFIEGFHKPLFGKRRHFIDMISVGIVAEDGREYYALSSDYDYKDADNWVKENVIHKLYIKHVHGDERNSLTTKNFNKHLGKPNERIKNEILRFVNTPNIFSGEHMFSQFYGYYSDYDWVLFCSLFGRMIDLPEGFPMFCLDLKQEFDSKISDSEIRSIGYNRAVERLKSKKGYPEQKDEHDCLADARWNMQLYKWLKTF